jgi:hypothetical protein
MVVSVYPIPSSGSISGSSSVSVSGGTITLIDGTGSGVWSCSNGNATIGSGTGVVTGVSTGADVVSYTVTSIYGCSSTATKNITVGPTPPPNSGKPTDTVTVTKGAVVSLQSGTGGGYWSSAYSAGIITLDAQTGLVTGIAEGRVMVTYTVTNNQGSNSTWLTEVIVTPGTESVSAQFGPTAEISIFPNPNNGNFNVRGMLTNISDEVVTIEVLDMTGQLVYKTNSASAHGKINEPVQLKEALSNGTYILKLHADSGDFVFHFVVSR